MCEQSVKPHGGIHGGAIIKHHLFIVGRALKDVKRLGEGRMYKPVHLAVPQALESDSDHCGAVLSPCPLELGRSSDERWESVTLAL